MSITGSAFSPSADRLPEAPPNCTTCVSLKLVSRRRAARHHVGGPARDLLAECQGRGRLQQGAAEHRRAAMLAGEAREGRDDGVELLQDRRQRLAELQHHRAVDDVLAGGAPVDVARGLGVALGDLLGQRLHHRPVSVAVRRAASTSCADRRARIARLDDDRRHALGDQSGFGDGLRERRLEPQHVAQRGESEKASAASTEEPSALTRPAGHGQTSKKTVSLGPPRSIGRRQAPVVITLGDQRVAARRLDQLQHGIVTERRISVEVEPRRQPIEHAAGEDRDVDVRRLQAARRPRHAAGLDRGKPARAVGKGRGAA